MNYTEKVDQQVKAILEPFEEELLKEIKKLVLESFKNGIDVGKQRKAGRGGEVSEKDEQEKEE
jgi:hypothetical protein